MATRTIANGGGNWNTAGTWVEGAVPTSADDVVATSTSGNLTINGASSCRSINLTNYGTHTLTHNASSTLSIGDGTAGAGNVALYFPSTITYKKLAGGSSLLAFISTSGTQQTIDLGGATNASVTFNGTGGSWKLLSGLTGWTGTSAILTLVAGSLDTNGQTITMGSFVGSGSGTRSLTLGTSSLSFGATGFRAWDCRTTTNLTLSASSSTITLTGASPTFDGNGGSYGALVLTGSGTSTLISGHTFTSLTRSNAGACSLVLPAGATTTITGSFQASGTSGNVVTITSSSAGSAATLSKSSGIVSCDYMSLKDSAATGGAGWYAGHNSTSVSGNTGWVFADYFSTTATLTGSGALAATADVTPGFTTHNATGTLTGAGSAAATATRVVTPTATLTGAGSVASTALRTATATATLAGSGSVASAATRATFAAATLAGSGSLASTAARTAVATGTLAGVGSISGSAIWTALITGTLAGTGSLSSAASVSQTVTATLTGSALLDATGVRGQFVTGWIGWALLPGDDTYPGSDLYPYAGAILTATIRLTQGPWQQGGGDDWLADAGINWEQSVDSEWDADTEAVWEQSTSDTWERV